MADSQQEQDGQPGQQPGQTFHRSHQDELNQSYRDRERQGSEQGDRDRTQGREQHGGQGHDDENRRGGQSGVGKDRP